MSDQPIVHLRKTITHHYEISSLELVEVNSIDGEIAEGTLCVVCDAPIDTDFYGIGETLLHGDIFFDDFCYAKVLEKFEENKREWANKENLKK